MLKLRHFDRALRYEFRMDELKARQEVGAGGTATASKHYPEEWGPSDNRKLTCSCGNPDPDHLTHNAPHEGRTAALSPSVPLDAVVGHLEER